MIDQHAADRYPPIENHGVIGNMHTVALVRTDATIDFLCFPDFDSPSIFASLLDHQRGGHFSLAPVIGDARPKQLYLPDTNVLLTRFLSESGVAEVSDFMPVEGGAPRHCLVRRAKTVRGANRFRMLCTPAFDYARADHQVEAREAEMIFSSNGADATVLRLRSEVPLELRGGAAMAEFDLAAGETVSFVLEEVTGARESAASADDFVPRVFKDTVNFWRSWIGRSRYRGRWREMVNRSALALKMLTHEKHGSIIAAPTFGLPEYLGGERNWDYRYTWLRDAAFTLYALIRLGYTEETASFMQWLEERCGEAMPSGSLQIMYAIDGHHDLTEQDLPHLEGYRASRPVRIGNGAHNQLQLDVYGELMDSAYLYDKYGQPISHGMWDNIVQLLAWLLNNWRRADEGIWEVRGGRQEFLYSRLMSWVALDRGIRLAQKRSLPAPLEEWSAARNEIYLEIHRQFWHPELGAFVQHKETQALDASSLLMPLVRFISPTDPRWLSHLKALEGHLVSDSLVYRYDLDAGASNGLAGDEGTFNMCTFWYVESLARAGDLQKARFVFEKMLGYANHLGLYSEELGLRGEHLGNFPQAFTHLSLISAAFDLDRKLEAAGFQG